MVTEAHINPSILSWARARAGLSPSALARGLSVKTAQVIAWEAAQSVPTFKQAQRLATVTHVPFGFLFLPEPPTEQLPLPDLRTVGGAQPDRPSINLLDTVKDVLRKQSWYADYLKNEEGARLKLVKRFSAESSVGEVVRDMHRLLGGNPTSNPVSPDEYFRNLIRAAELGGILVMRSGIVGANTHRKLDVGEFRGFAINDDIAPIVFINSADAPAAKMFTLVHELAHIWIGSSGVSNQTRGSSRKEEIFCNAVAGEFLVPEQELVPRWKSNEPWREMIGMLATVFHVSRLTVARRASDLGLISQDDYDAYHRSEIDAYRRIAKSGGSFYRNAGAKNSVSFSKAVIAEAMSGRLLLRDAGRLLGIHPAKIGVYAETLSE